MCVVYFPILHFSVLVQYWLATYKWMDGNTTTAYTAVAWCCAVKTCGKNLAVHIITGKCQSTSTNYPDTN